MKKTSSVVFPSIGNLNSYIRIAHSFPVLSIKKEKILTYKLFYEGDLQAARTLILSHLRFVIYISRNYSGYGLLQADLIQEGSIGLMKAVKKFNPQIGVRLISFAVHWIKAEIHEYVLRNWRIVKVATTKSQRKLFFNLRKNKKKLGWFSDAEVILVARDLGVSVKDVREMESRMSAQDIPFNPASKEEKENYRENFSIFHLDDKKSNFSVDLEKDNWRKYVKKKLNNAISKLDARSKYIINKRWLNNNSKKTLQKIAVNYGISAERVRQLEKNAMKKLKSEIES